MTPAALSRWLGISVGLHALLASSIWLGLPQVAPRSPQPGAGFTTVVALVDLTPNDVAQPLTTPHRPAPRPTEAPRSAQSLQELPTPEPPSLATETSVEETDYREPDRSSDAQADPTPTEPSPDVSSYESPEASPDASSRPSSTSLEGAGDPGDACDAYASALVAQLAAEPYPPLARLRGLVGRVDVAYAITPEGRVTEPHVVAPSRHPELNWAALRAVERLGAVLRQPGAEPLRCSVAIEFRLSEAQSMAHHSP